jgi:cytochrome b561
LFWALVALVAIHAAAALYHHLFQHDATLTRMLPERRRAPSNSPASEIR